MVFRLWYSSASSRDPVEKMRTLNVAIVIDCPNKGAQRSRSRILISELVFLLAEDYIMDLRNGSGLIKQELFSSKGCRVPPQRARSSFHY